MQFSYLVDFGTLSAEVRPSYEDLHSYNNLNMKNRLGKIVLLAGGFCSFLVASTFANPTVLVTYNNIVYDVTYEELNPWASSGPDLSTLMAQPWWHNTAAAMDFAASVAGALGTPNLHLVGPVEPGDGIPGPYFAFDQFAGNGVIAVSYEDAGDSFSPDWSPPADVTGLFPGNYAFAVLVPTVPDRLGTLTCLSLVSLSLIVLRRYLRPQSAAA